MINLISNGKNPLPSFMDKMHIKFNELLSLIGSVMKRPKKRGEGYQIC